MGKYCQNCGKKLENNAKFCSKCGTRCESNAEPVAWEEAQSDTQMGYEFKPGMSPEDMAAKWAGVNWGKNDGMDNLTAKSIKGIGRALYPRYYTNCFKALLNEMQSDEKGLIYFRGSMFRRDLRRGDTFWRGWKNLIIYNAKMSFQKSLLYVIL